MPNLLDQKKTKIFNNEPISAVCSFIRVLIYKHIIAYHYFPLFRG